MTTPPLPDRTGRTEATNRADDPLVGALNNVAGAVADLVAESRKRERRLLVLLGVVALLVIALGGMGLSNRQLNTGNGEILRTIRDCTTEEAPGDCFERNQARTAAYLTELAASEFDIAWCVRVSDTKAEAERCVTAARTARAGK